MLCRCKHMSQLEKKLSKSSLGKPVYLDYCASTPVDVRVLREFERYCTQVWGNPSSIHQAGLTSAKLLENAKITIGKTLATAPERIYFCSSATEAMHAALFGLRSKDTTFISTTIEHSSITRPLQRLKQRGFDVHFIPVDSSGKVQMLELEKRLQESKKAVFAYSPVNHEVGSIQLCDEIYRLKQKYPLTVVIDGVQAITRLNPYLWIRNADFVTLSSHKFYSPKGTGILAVRDNNIKLRPFRYGGKQEGGLFPGTENVPNIAATARALELLVREFDELSTIERTLTNEGIGILQKEIDGVVINTPQDNCATGIINISLPQLKNIKDVVMSLSYEGICVSRFSACNGKLSGTSEILLAMERSRRVASTSLRISIGRFSSRDDFYRLARILKQILQSQ